MSPRRILTLTVPVLAISIGAFVHAQQPASSAVADAARKGDATAVRTLLKSGADASAPEPDGMTALHWAAERGDATMADMLLVAGANPSAVTRIGGYTPLHVAAETGSGPVVRALLKKGANPKQTAASGVTPLHLAAKSGSADAVNALLEAGADANVKENEYGQTPLIFAANEGQVATINALLKHGADVNLASKVIDLSKVSALDRAAATQRRAVLAASVPAGSEATFSQYQAAIQAGREIVLSGKIPPPPANAAANGAAGGGRGGGGGFAGGGRGGGGAAAPPAAAPADPVAGGDTTAQAGGRAAGGTGSGNDPLNQDGPPPAINAKGGMAPIHYAARQGHVAAAAALLDAGANVNMKTGDGNSPMLVAIINGQFDLAMLLIERGANVNEAAEGLGVTPLWAAVNAMWQPRTRFPQPQEMDLQKATYLDVMEALLKKGADPNSRVKVHPWYLVYTGCGNGNCGLSSTVGSTAFWRAAYGTDVPAMKLLVKYGADPNIPTMTAAGGGGGRGGGRGGGGGGGAAFGGRGAGGAGGAAPNGSLDDPTGAAPPNPQAAAAAGAAGAQGGRGGAQGGRGGGGGGGRGGGNAGGPDPSGLPPVPAGGPAVYPIHAASGVEYGEGFAGNAHRHAPDSWLAAVKYLVEELGADVNQRDDGGYTPLHHAAARGDNELIQYLVSKGADVKAVSRRGQTTADMANAPVSRISPFPDTIALLVKLGAVNNNKCASCNPVP